MNPSSAVMAKNQVRFLLSLPRVVKDGRYLSPASKIRNLKRAEAAASSIWCRWKVGVWGWKEKHVRWYLDIHLVGLATSTRYLHLLSVQRVCAATNRKFLKRGPVE